MLGNEQGRELCTAPTEYVLFDLETTGLSSERDRIIEIAAVRVKDGQIVEEFSTLVNPEMPIGRSAMAVNHISNEMVADAPVLAEAMPRFLDFIADRIIVGHNIKSFDMKFLNKFCMEAYGQVIGNEFIDTVRMSRTLLPGMKHSMAALTEYFEIQVKDAHRALGDCRMNMEVFEKLKERIQSEDRPVCPKCGSLLVKRSGRFGEFYGCSGYPNCRYTKNI